MKIFLSFVFLPRITDSKSGLSLSSHPTPSFLLKRPPETRTSMDGYPQLIPIRDLNWILRCWMCVHKLQAITSLLIPQTNTAWKLGPSLFLPLPPSLLIPSLYRRLSEKPRPAGTYAITGLRGKVFCQEGEEQLAWVSLSNMNNGNIPSISSNYGDWISIFVVF